MDRSHFLRSQCKSSPGGQCCQTACLQLGSVSKRKRTSTTSVRVPSVVRAHVHSVNGPTAVKETVVNASKRVLDYIQTSDIQRSSLVETPLSSIATYSSLNATLSSVCPCSSCPCHMSKNLSSSLLESEIDEASTLSKTGYTYSKSRSYRQRVSPERIIPPPNMSRSRVSGAGYDLTQSVTHRDEHFSRSGSALSNTSTHSYYLRSGSGSPEQPPRDGSPVNSQRRKRLSEIGTTTRESTAFRIQRGLDVGTDSSPEDTVPRRRSVTPLAAGGGTTVNTYGRNGRTSLLQEYPGRLTPLGEDLEEEEVTVIKRIIKVFKIYNERIIRYVTNSVAPRTAAPPDVAASAAQAMTASVPSKKKRKCMSLLGWLLLPLLLLGILLYNPSREYLLAQMRSSFSTSEAEFVPVLPPSGEIGDSQRTWVLSAVNSVVDSRLNELVSKLDGRFESDQGVLKEDMEQRFKVLQDLLASVQSDLQQSKVYLGKIQSHSSTEQERLSQIEERLRVSTVGVQENSEEMLALRQFVYELKVELGQTKSCCKGLVVLDDLSLSVSQMKNRQDRFESLVASLDSEQKGVLEAKVSEIRAEFTRQLNLIEVTLRAEAESTRSILMEDVAARVATLAAASAMTSGTKTTEGAIGGASEEFIAHAIAEALLKYDADKIGMADYALESAGAEIASIRCTESYSKGSGSLRLFGIPLWYPTNNPRVAIQRGVNPGECWAFMGSVGYLVVKLARPIRVTGITVEHIPKSISVTDSIDTAPKDFMVYGLLRLQDPSPVELGNFTYDTNSTPLQTFYVTNKDASDTAFPYVELKILSNSGNKDYTCLYRFRVHGVPSPPSEKAKYEEVTADVES